MNKNTSLLLGLVAVSISFATAVYFSQASNVKSTTPNPHVAIDRTISSLGFENKCQAFYNGTIQREKLLSKQGIRFFENPKSGRRMAYEYVPPAQKGGKVILFLHGLGDKMFSLQGLAEKAMKDGFGILRVDLHGHGETLNEYLKLHKNELPDTFDYRDNVEDIGGLIHAMRLSKITIVGHSYGGGIALKLGEVLPKSIVTRVVALAPYVQRIDKYISDSIASGQYAIDSVEKFIDTFSFSKEVTRPIVQNMMTYAQDFANQVKMFMDLQNLMLRTGAFKDKMLDPKLDKFMYDNYKKYFLFQLGKNEADLTQEQKELLELKTYAAIKVTKGVRGLDYLNRLGQIGDMPEFVQVIGGAEDKLVMMEQLQQFSSRLDRFGIKHELLTLKGQNSTHLFPQNMIDEVYEILLEGETRPGL